MESEVNPGATPEGNPEVNVVVVSGRLGRPMEERLLASGERWVGLEVSVRHEGRRSETVPVVWADPPAACDDLEVDDAVVVVGRVRRRFFRFGGGTQSRTEVVAEAVVPAGHVERVTELLEQVRTRMSLPS